MARKSHSPEQIITKLREVEILLNQGATLAIISKKIEVSDCTCCRWREEYCGLRADRLTASRSGKKRAPV